MRCSFMLQCNGGAVLKQALMLLAMLQLHNTSYIHRQIADL
jgi:hypothetical protein